LAVKEPAEGVFSIYSAGLGQQALDRLGDGDTSRNSVFTRVFVEQLKKPGTNLIDLGEAVRDEVAAIADTIAHPQVPAVYNQIRGARTVFLDAHRSPAPAHAVAGVHAGGVRVPTLPPLRGRDRLPEAGRERGRPA
jgi:hypothetical protein